MSNLELTMMKRVGELNAEIKLRTAELTACKAESDRLKAEVDNLRKNADISPSQSPHESAKEGKPSA